MAFSDYGVAGCCLVIRNPLRDSLLWVRIWVKGWPMFLPILFLIQKVKNHHFRGENGGFLVAEAGLEPTTSGL